MKKVIGIAVVLLLACAVMASASATNWQLSIKASDSADLHFNGNLTIGTQSTYTDGLDSGAKGEPGIIGTPPPGASSATVATQIGAAAPGILDLRAPVTEAMSKSWTVQIYVIDSGGGPINPVKVRITPGTGTYAPVYTIGTTAYAYTFAGTGVPGGSVTYDGNTPMSTSFFYNYTDPGTSFATGSALTVTFAPVVPEPGSMLALGSGLVGLIGFGIRRRRS